MDFKVGIFLLWVGLDKQRLEISVMLVVKKRPDGEESGRVVVCGEGDLPLYSLQLDVDEDGDCVALDLLLLIYHCFIKTLPPFYSLNPCIRKYNTRNRSKVECLFGQKRLEKRVWVGVELTYKCGIFDL